MSCPARLLSTINGGAVLDAGCGAGRFTRLLAEHLAEFKSIIGIDPHKDSLDEARRLTDDRRISFRNLGVMDLEPSPPRFDTVGISYALHHMADAHSALDRLVSVLVPGGTLLVLEVRSDGLSPAQEAAREVHHFKAAVDQSRGMVHQFTFTRDEIISMIQRAGLVIHDICEETPPADASEEERVEDALKLIQEYSEFIDGDDELQERKSAVVARLRRDGLTSPPHLLISTQKPVH